MAQLISTDVLLVNRADATYQMTFAELEASVNDKLQNGLTLSGDPLPVFEDSDLFVVNRDDITYKIYWGADVFLSENYYAGILETSTTYYDHIVLEDGHTYYYKIKACGSYDSVCSELSDY